ncbi:MAG TPA: PilZ domain-containing protein [Rhodopseudomonas sp.]|uniref:PilZ domain-containing protein n=1 Tax=Rhodopseudomonas sp. TaxID=1078 RepID=UPI002ED797CD
MSVEKFLRQRAVNVVVGGHYKLANWYDVQGKPRNFACRTSRVSPFRMIMAVPVVGRIGDHITSYFGEFGQLEGRISDTMPGSFLLELAMPHALRRKLADQLAWLEAKQKDPSIRDARRQARIVPATPHSTLTFADGTIHGCFVIDMSVSGAAISADVQPEVGTPLAVGACVGRVVRHLNGGFAVKFVEQVSRDDLERRIVRPPPLTAPQPPADPRPQAAADDDKYVYLNA